MNPNPSVEFFDRQFQRQVAAEEHSLNPFELAALPHLRGKVLDYGCGLGHLAVEAARRGCSVVALDGSRTAIEYLQGVARREQLPIETMETDLSTYEITETFDVLVCIGLLMFFDCPTAYRQLASLQAHTRPGGMLIVNVLVEGTTYMDMFAPEGYCLFTPDDLRRRLVGWHMIGFDSAEFDAPGNTRKAFATAIACKPLDGDAAPPDQHERAHVR